MTLPGIFYPKSAIATKISSPIHSLPVDVPNPVLALYLTQIK